MQLTQFKRLSAAIILLSYLFVSISAVAGWYVADTIMEMEFIQSAATGLAAGILASLLAYFLVHSTITRPFEILVQGILHVSSDEGDNPEPDTSKIVLGHKLLNQTLNALYDLAAVSNEQNESIVNQHTFMFELLKANPLPIIVLDSAKKVRYFNAAAGNVLSISAGSGVGVEFSKAFNLSYKSDENLDSWIEACKQSQIKAKTNFERVRIQKADKEYMYDMMALYSKNDPHGIETLITLFDHTDRYEADESEVSFVSLAVHELRSPITVLKGYMEVFEEELGPTLNDEQRVFLQKMNVSAAALSTFVNNILNVARVDSEQMSVHMIEENWVETIKNAAADFAIRVKLRNRVLKLAVPEQLPHVAVDMVSIYEVLSNLIDNAIKYSHDGGEIIIRSYEKDGMIETTVQDFGIGIPGNVIEHLFNKFYRSHRSRDSIGGTGLGLYLSKAIVEAHGGSIWVKSNEGEGSTFGFTIPIYANVAQQLEKGNNEGQITRSAHGWIKNHNMIRK